MRFVVLEGLDGSGTTTQLGRLVDHLDAVRTAEPTDGPVGRIARSSLRAEPGAPAMDALPWLFAADRADHLSRVVEPALAQGRTVVSDRYVPSSLAYQSLTLPLEDVWALNASFRVPDLLLFVEVDVDTALARIASRAGQTEIYDTRERLTQVADAYDRVLTFLEVRGWPVVRIDGRPDPDTVWASIREAL